MYPWKKSSPEAWSEFPRTDQKDTGGQHCVSVFQAERECGQENRRLGAQTSGLEMFHLQDWKGSLISSPKPCVHLHIQMFPRPRATCLSPSTACITSLSAPAGFCVPKKSFSSPYGTKPKVGWHLDSSYSGLLCRTLSWVSSLKSGGLSPCLLELVSKDELIIVGIWPTSNNLTPHLTARGIRIGLRSDRNVGVFEVWSIY